MIKCELCGSTESLFVNHNETHISPPRVLTICRSCHSRLKAHSKVGSNRGGISEHRKISYDSGGTPIVRLPKHWIRLFGFPAEVDMLSQNVVCIFPPNIKTNAERADALKKIITILESVPEPPYPIARQRRKK